MTQLSTDQPLLKLQFLLISKALTGSFLNILFIKLIRIHSFMEISKQQMQEF